MKCNNFCCILLNYGPWRCLSPCGPPGHIPSEPSHFPPHEESSYCSHQHAMKDYATHWRSPEKGVCKECKGKKSDRFWKIWQSLHCNAFLTYKACIMSVPLNKVLLWPAKILQYQPRACIQNSNQLNLI